MPVIGAGTFNPNAGFSFPRSYVFWVAFPSDWTLESHTDGQFVFNDFMFYNDRIYINLYHSFWAWNSNRYTLDHIVVDCYYHPLPSTVDTPTPFSLSYIAPTPTRKATIRLLSPFFGTGLQYFALPSPSVPYWLP